MERYRGQPLPARAHVAVMVWDKPGNFVVGTVVLRALRERLPGCTIDYFGGERTREFEEASRLIDARHSLVGLPEGLAGLSRFVGERIARHGPYDLGINLDFEPCFATAMGLLAPRYVAGPSYEPDLRRVLPPAVDRQQRLDDDLDWNRASLPEEYADLIGSNYMGELWCRRAGLVTDFFRPEVPTADPGPGVPEVLVATGGTRTTKIWPIERWLALTRLLRDDGLSVGLVGVARRQQGRYGSSADDDDRLVDEGGLIDLRGRWTLPQVAGAARAARAAVTIDNAIGHIAAAVGTPTVIMWGGSPWRLWGSRMPNARHLLPTQICALCEQHRFRNQHCLRERQVCMESITPRRVHGELRALLRSQPVGSGAGP
jgi:ADP-heptose:LPS heptosyltransferase